MAANEQASGTNAMSSEFINDWDIPYPVRNVSGVYRDGYGVELSLKDSTSTMKMASYMPYADNWKIGNYTLEMFLDSNVAVNVAILETNGWLAGIRLQDDQSYTFLYSGDYNTITAEQANQASSDENGFDKKVGEKTYKILYNNVFTFYDHTKTAEYKKLTGEDLKVLENISLIYKPSDESPNVKIKFDNDNNLITYYVLLNRSTDANVVDLEWSAVAAIGYADYDSNGNAIDINPMFGITAKGSGSGTDTINIRNANVWGKNFNTANDGDVLQSVDFEGADKIGYDTTTGKVNTSENSSGYLWNTLDWTNSDETNGISILDKYGADGFYDTLVINPYVDPGMSTRAFAQSRLNNEWNNTNITMELAVNCDQPVIIDLLCAHSDYYKHPFGFTLSGNNPALYDRKTESGTVQGSDSLAYFTNGRFAVGGNSVYQNFYHVGGVNNTSDSFNASGIDVSSYYYAGGYEDSPSYNAYPTRVDTTDTGEANVKVEFNYTLKQLTLYELCYNDDDLTDNIVDTTKDISWKKIGIVDFSEAAEKNWNTFDAVLYFFAWEYNSNAYISNVKIVKGQTATHNYIDGFEGLQSGDEIASLELGKDFVKAHSSNSYGANLPFDINSVGSFTVGMLVDTDLPQYLSLLKTGDSSNDYSTLGFTFDANNVVSSTRPFVVGGRTVDGSNSDIENILSVKLDACESMSARYYADGITENVRIEFNSVEGIITLYELVDMDKGDAVVLRYVRTAEITCLDFTDYEMIFEGTAQYSNIKFVKGFHAVDVGIRAKQISNRYDPDGVLNSAVDVRYVITVENENYYYAGVAAYLVQNDGTETKTSNTLVRTVDVVGYETLKNDKFQPLAVDELNSGGLLYTVTIKGIPIENLAWIEVHVMPFVINQKFDGNGDFVYNDQTDVNQLIKDWNYGKGTADIGTLGVERIAYVSSK